MENQNNYSRRRFLSLAALTVAVAELGGLNLLNAKEIIKNKTRIRILIDCGKVMPFSCSRNLSVGALWLVERGSSVAHFFR